MEGAFAAALQQLLQDVGHAEPRLDEDVQQYMLAMLEDEEPDASECLDTLQELLSSTVPAFAKQTPERQQQLALELLEAASSKPQQSACELPQQQKHQEHVVVGAVLAALRQASLEQQPQHEQPAPCADVCAAAAAGPGSAASQADLALLAELGPPGLGEAFLVHVLQERCGGDVQAAADWLLEHDERQLWRQQALWEEEQEEEQEEQQRAEVEKKQAKQKIVDRFDLQAVPGSGGGRKKPGKPAADLLPAKASDQAAPKVRYREGQVVSLRGDKYVVERVGDEWDGGSRGRVYTKGKRGKGFV